MLVWKKYQGEFNITVRGLKFSQYNIEYSQTKMV